MTRAVHVRLQRVRASDMHIDIALRLAIDIGAPSLHMHVVCREFGAPRMLFVGRLAFPTELRVAVSMVWARKAPKGRRRGFNLLLLNLKMTCEL